MNFKSLFSFGSQKALTPAIETFESSANKATLLMEEKKWEDAARTIGQAGFDQAIMDYLDVIKASEAFVNAYRERWKSFFDYVLANAELERAYTNSYVFIDVMCSRVEAAEKRFLVASKTLQAQKRP